MKRGRCFGAMDWSSAAGSSFSSMDKRPAGTASSSLRRYRNDHSQILSSNPAQLDKQFQKISLSLPAPRQETLSRLNFRPQRNSLVQPDSMAIRDAGQGAARTAMESVLSLDDGKWSHPAEESLPALINEVQEDPFKLVSIKQPSPPPFLARLQQGSAPIPPSQVADPRPGPAKPFQHTPDSYQHLHPVNMMEDFLRLARANTAKNLETCGVLAGSLKNRVFHITTLIIPKQESTSDSIMLPEAVAIVMAPTDTSSPHGIFHLSDPSGVNVICNCQERGFHPYEEPSDGSPIYEHCSHVYMNSKLKFEIVDLW
ncbi:hypothetical protein CDL15_Pgr016649 [Punica granatum]|uniref:Uncharacterized protein n=1 Tax=Punica granatum TaxID=22663 RepID=A0A218XTU9_PUNGR|nr:hypothetical protein CDL15_Pgr016649 [Punica granatum]